MQNKLFSLLLLFVGIITSLLSCAPVSLAQTGNATIPPSTDNASTAAVESTADNQTKAAYVPSLRKGYPAPDFKLATTKGDSISLGKQHGKYVLINFWAAWCDPCKRELPHFQTFYQQNKDQSLILLTVCSDSNINDVNDFIFQNGLQFPVLLDPNGKVRRLYSYDGKKLLVIPTTFLIDPDGTVIGIYRRMFSDAEDIRNTIKAAQGD